jgi:DNA-binding CsgD family transcriptional regulator
MKPKLTPRQAEITELLSLGLAQKEIADHLRISVNTVDMLIRQAKQRVGVQKNTELVAWYYINRYKLSLNLSPVKRALIAASLLSLSIFAIAFENNNMLRVLRPVRILRSARSGRGRSREEFEETVFFEDYIKLVS